MDHCLAPDASGGLGMDNMTIMVIALLHGRSLDQWYDWVADRVENCVGYITPEEVPSVYTPARLAMANERKRRGFTRATFDDEDDVDDMRRSPIGLPGLTLSGPLGGLARILAGSGADVNFLSTTASTSIRTTADLFSGDSSDEEDERDAHKWTSNANHFGPAHIESIDDEDMDEEDNRTGFTSFGGYFENRPPSGREMQGEAPPSPKPKPEREPGPPSQLPHEPQGDELHPAMKVEGQLDASEDPLKSAASVQ